MTESVNCRMEASYGHQQELDMVPMMMQKDYRAQGWLGLFLGCAILPSCGRSVLDHYYPSHSHIITIDCMSMCSHELLVQCLYSMVIGCSYTSNHPLD